MKILAYFPHDGQLIEVQITGTIHHADGRVLAVVEAVDGGQHFSSWSHGGWCTSSSTIVPVQALRDIVIGADLQPVVIPQEV